jgi:hypothetical protein
METFPNYIKFRASAWYIKVCNCVLSCKGFIIEGIEESLLIVLFDIIDG